MTDVSTATDVDVANELVVSHRLPSEVAVPPVAAADAEVSFADGKIAAVAARRGLDLLTVHEVRLVDAIVRHSDVRPLVERDADRAPVRTKWLPALLDECKPDANNNRATHHQRQHGERAPITAPVSSSSPNSQVFSLFMITAWRASYAGS